MPDPIRGMMTQDGFNIRKILDLPVEISVGELLSRSDSIKELAYNHRTEPPASERHPPKIYSAREGFCEQGISGT